VPPPAVAALWAGPWFSLDPQSPLMMLGLSLAIAISLFAVGGATLLLWRYRDWRFGFLAALCLFAAAWVLTSQVSRLLALGEDWSLKLSDFGHAFPAMILSLMALSAIYFLERAIGGRIRAARNLELAQLSLDGAGVPVFWFAADGSIRYANEAASRSLGYDRTQLLSMTIFDIAPLYPTSNWPQDFATLKAQGSSSLELHFSTKGAHIYPVDVTAIRVSSQDEELACVFARDISERKQAEADLRIALSQVEAADRAKSEFLSTMSHELRTPLNAIMGFAEIMEMEMFGPLGSERYTSCAGDIHHSARHLLGIINGVLDLSKAEAGRLTLDEEEVVLDEIFSQCLRLFREKASLQGISLTMACAPDIPNLLADSRILRQIVINLVSNALKFTPQDGRIVVSAGVAPSGGCTIVVEDTGCGISEENLALVTEPFLQIENALTRRHEGTGLGLALVKKYTELHGGELELESALDRGTKISVHFPPERTIPAEVPAAGLESA
jgi:PAS domain S-box-containing protein